MLTPDPNNELASALASVEVLITNAWENVGMANAAEQSDNFKTFSRLLLFI
jgi:hypothetical protein